MKTKSKLRSFLSALLALAMLLSSFPMVTYAAQSNEYVDPADMWLSSNNRTNELDVNSTTTYETQYCAICDKETTVLTYRVPEYTRSGETALNRDVRYSDGTKIDGRGQGNLDSGTPGVDAYFTGYHWTKVVCQNCGTINSGSNQQSYGFNNNVYSLHSCDNNFFLQFDNTTHEHYNEEYHLTTLKRGEYCKFCKGTYARATQGLQEHSFVENIDGQVGNNRFYIAEICSDCGYETSEYVTAKSVVTSYYGVEDGEAHTLAVSDLSDSGVRTSIRYGTSADNCTKTSAPNYTQAGYYTVYYEIDYSYAGEVMTENGVSYVWLVAEDEDSNGTIVVLPQTHEHEFHYLETIKPSCDELGYDRFQCNGCGQLEKRNYTPSLGHDYDDIVIREATCKQGGLVLTLCADCGDFYQTTTATGAHSYKSVNHTPTCRNVGYTEYTCEVCGDNYINNIQPLISHSYERITKEPTCIDRGYTTSTCTMCGYNYVDDYVDELGHSWDEGHTVTASTCTGEGIMEYNCQNTGCTEKMIQAMDAAGHTPGDEATCTEPQKCIECETVLELPKGHAYDSEVTAPTCTAMGYTTNSCISCGDTYLSDYVDPTPHEYEETVIPATCTSLGYSVFRCADCDDEYKADYTDMLEHTYVEDVTAPTCTSLGYSTFTCSGCDVSYVGNYVDKTPHNYNKEVIPPTCVEHGHSVYECPDCGASYIDEIVESTEHTYEETKIPATCTSLGYSIFKCTDCDDEYVSNYVDKLPHDYEATVIPATCTGLGHSEYQCKNCPDNYKSDYTEPTGHNPSDWIIDTPATIEHAGAKHIECLTCGTVIQESEIPQLIDVDRSDEDGEALVGAYSIILTDSKNIPVFDSEITIDVNDNVTIRLPEERLLDYKDQTTITVFNTETQEAVTGLRIFVYDAVNNAATGATDENGQLKVPNNQSSTGDDNGTIGKDENEEKLTFVVRVSDKENVVIPDCDVYIGESNNIVVDLPEGIKPSVEAPVIVTVEDQYGNPQKNVTIIALGDNDYIEKGKTDIYGRVTLPMVNEGFTNDEGHVTVDNINVIVNDEIGLIADAFVKHNEDGTVSVTLPEGKGISHSNRITVTVLDSEALAVKDKSITVTDLEEKTYTDITDESGKIVVPPLSEDYSDETGMAVVNGYTVFIADEINPIADAFIEIENGAISITLPEGANIDYNNRITATVTKDDEPVKDIPVSFTDTTGKTEINLTDENGKAVVPPANIDFTDVNGFAQVDGYSVTVNDEKGFVEKAFITHTEDDKLDIKLPDNLLIEYGNRITVQVLDKETQAPVKDLVVIVNEVIVPTESGEETPVGKTMTDTTDSKGIAVFPPLSEDITDNEGGSNVTDKTEEEDKDTDGDGTPDTPGETIEQQYIVSVKDTKGIIPDAFVKISNGKISVTLPEGKTLTTSNQTTVTVLDKESKPVSGVSVTITDSSNTSKSGTTNANGQVTLPVKSSGGGGGGGGSSSSGGGGGYYSGGGIGGSYSSTTVNVVDKDGKTVSVSKSTTTTQATLTLPAGKNLLKDDNYYKITVTSGSQAKPGYTVVLKDRSGNEVSGVTDASGKLTLPGVKHTAYIFGYPDGTFRPNGNMRRSEAAAIFARLIAEAKNESISGRASFKDVDSDEWYASYVAYLEKYDVIRGYSDNTFRADNQVTRAEFVAMSVRYYDLFGDLPSVSNTNRYSDVSSSYWAVKEISVAKEIGWLNGYADGTFRGDNKITRAEAVTVINHATERNPDKEHINENFTKLNRFTDITDSSAWFFYDVMESCNTHLGAASSDGENWID